MTKGIRDFFNLPQLEDVLKEEGVDVPTGLEPEAEEDDDDDASGIDPGMVARLEAAAKAARSADAAMARMDGLDHGEAMDDITRQTLQHAKDLVDLGFNVDHARAAKFFDVAASMYDKAIKAKTSKRDAQLKTMTLALDARKMDMDERRLRHEMGEQDAIVTPDANVNVVVEDRNAIIKRFLEEKKNKPE